MLRRHDTGPVESTTFRMGHALAAEPGTEARPPITEAVRVDGVLTDWFRNRLAHPPANTRPAEDGDGAWSSSAQPAGSTPQTAEPDAPATQDTETDDVGTRSTATVSGGCRRP